VRNVAAQVKALQQSSSDAGYAAAPRAKTPLHGGAAGG
jgi:hypothetical protein